MSRLFDDDDWPVPAGPDVPVPSFLRDDSAGLRGPSDLSLTFQSRGPCFEGVTRTTWSSQAADPAYRPEPAYTPESAYRPEAAYRPESAHRPEPSYDPEPAYTSEPAYRPEPSYDPEPGYPPEHSFGRAPEPGGVRSSPPAWDPLFDPWPPVDHTAPVAVAQAPRALPTQPWAAELASEHPSGPLPRTPPPSGFTADAGPSAYDVTLTGALGYADLGFRDGRWYALGSRPRSVSTRDALRAHPELGGPIVQVVCWWMRQNPCDARALDAATELAFAVAEVARQASPTGP